MLEFIHRQMAQYTKHVRRYDKFEAEAFPERVKNRNEYWQPIFNRLRQAMGTPIYSDILNEPIPDYL